MNRQRADALMLDLAPQLQDPPPVDHPAVQWNPAEMLAPVGCWLLVILPDGTVTHAKRTQYIEQKSRQQEYHLRDGTYIKGKLKWTAA